MDFTIQKAVELGVAAIQPVFSEKSLVRLSGEREAKKLLHWQRIAIAACEQCGRNRIPEIREPVALERYAAPAGVKVLLSPSGTGKLADFATAPLVLACGPEAGFSDAEEAACCDRLSRGALGPRVLAPRPRRWRHWPP